MFWLQNLIYTKSELNHQDASLYPKKLNQKMPQKDRAPPPQLLPGRKKTPAPFSLLHFKMKVYRVFDCLFNKKSVDIYLEEKVIIHQVNVKFI